jgi:hypothetical protein
MNNGLRAESVRLGCDGLPGASGPGQTGAAAALGGVGESRNDEIRTDYLYVIELSMKKTSAALGWLRAAPGCGHMASPRPAPSGSLSGGHTLIGGEKRAFSPGDDPQAPGKLAAHGGFTGAWEAYEGDHVGVARDIRVWAPECRRSPLGPMAPCTATPTQNQSERPRIASPHSMFMGS